MTAVASPLTGASSAFANWDSINWDTVKTEVRRLQMRIAKAISEGRHGRVKSLQWLLTHSFYAKLLAVKRVVQNRGGKTPGIDKIIWQTPQQKWNAAESLTRAGYQTQPLRRIYIPKKDGRQRLLSTVVHSILLEKIATRVDDKDVMHLLKLILKTSEKLGIPQGSPLSPLASNIYLNEIDKMLERAKKVTGGDGYQHIEYARWADDIVILIDAHPDWYWLREAVHKRLREELAKLKVELNDEKTKTINLKKGETFSFLGFDFRRGKTKQGKWGIQKTPKMMARTNLLRNMKEIFRRHQSQPIDRVIDLINPILRGWVNYFRI